MRFDASRTFNAAGFSVETIAAEYETDAALAELGMGSDYFYAAFRAEDEQRSIDAFHASYRIGGTA